MCEKGRNDMGNKVKIAVNGGIGFGAKLNLKQLMTISKHMNMESLSQVFIGSFFNTLNLKADSNP
jgi:hypothetical protein